MKVHIINISDFPAHISTEEQEKWEQFLQENNYMYENHIALSSKKSTTLFHELLSSQNTEMILFSSGWFHAINQVSRWLDRVWSEKIIIWFSDTLHIQAKYSQYDNVFNVYGLTMRNIFLLWEKHKNLLHSCIYQKKYIYQLIPLKEYKNSISGKVFWGHIMIFVTTLLLYNIYPKKGDILYLEFHGMEEYLISYYLDILKNLWVFKLCSGIIFDLGFNISFEREAVEKYTIDIPDTNIYIVYQIAFIPLYKKMNIDTWYLILQN